MYEKILITGTPGTGKTTLAKKLGEYFMTRVIHITDYVKKNDLILEKKKDGTLIVDMLNLRKRLNVEEGIIEGHLACEFKLRNSFVMVLRCDPKVLEKRMKKRKYKPKKIKDNLEVEALDYCSLLAESQYKKVLEIDTTERNAKEVFDESIKIIYGYSDGDRVNFSDYLGKKKRRAPKKIITKKRKLKKTTSKKIRKRK